MRRHAPDRRGRPACPARASRSRPRGRAPRAALIVTAASASSGVSRSSRQATVIASGRLGVGDVPGLKSVPSATGTPRVDERPRRRVRGPSSGTRSSPAGASRRPARPSAAAAASASIPASDGVARWSADAAPSSAASSAPPDGASSSACSRGRQPVAGRGLEDPPRLVGAEHAALAEHVAEAGPAVGGDAGQLLLDDGRGRTPRCRPGRARNSGGTAWAPRYVGTTSIGPSRPSR